MRSYRSIIEKIPLAKGWLLGGLFLGTVGTAIIGAQRGWWPMIASVVWAMWWAWMVLLSVVALTIVLLWVFPYYREKRFLTRWRVTAAAMLDHEMQPDIWPLRTELLAAKRRLRGMSHARVIEVDLTDSPPILVTDTPISSADGPAPDWEVRIVQRVLLCVLKGSGVLSPQAEPAGIAWYRLLRLLKHCWPWPQLSGLMCTMDVQNVMTKSP